MADIIPGTPVHFEGSSADASSSPINLIPHSPGDAGTLTGGMTGRCVAVTDITIIHATGGTVTLQSRTGTGTITLFQGTVAANGGVSRPFTLPAWGLRGGSLVLLAAAGQVNVQIEGSLVY